MSQLCRISSIRLLTITWLLSFIIMAILTRTIKASNSRADEWNNKYNLRLYSSLTGTIHELVPTDNSDDTDTRFQPPLNNNNVQHPGDESHHLENTRYTVPSIALTIPKEKVLVRRKRQAPLMAGSMTTSPMDGSGATEGGTTEFVDYTTSANETHTVILTEETDSQTSSSTSTQESITSAESLTAETETASVSETTGLISSSPTTSFMETETSAEIEPSAASTESAVYDTSETHSSTMDYQTASSIMETVSPSSITEETTTITDIFSDSIESFTVSVLSPIPTTVEIDSTERTTEETEIVTETEIMEQTTELTSITDSTTIAGTISTQMEVTETETIEGNTGSSSFTDNSASITLGTTFTSTITGAITTGELITVTESTEEPITVTASTEEPVIVTETTEEPTTVTEATEESITVTESTEIPIIVSESTEESMTVIESTEAATTAAESTEIPIIVTESTEQSMTIIESTEAAITVAESTEIPIIVTQSTEQSMTVLESTEAAITAAESTEIPIIVTESTEESMTVIESTEAAITVTESTEIPIIVTESTEQSMTAIESTEAAITVAESTEIPIIVTESTEQSMTIIESTEAAITVTESTEIPIIVTESTEESMTVIESTEAAITVTESTEIPIIVTESTEQSMTAIESTEAAITVAESTEIPIIVTESTEQSMTIIESTEAAITVTESTEIQIIVTESTEESMTVIESTEAAITVTESTEIPIIVTESTEQSMTAIESTEAAITVAESTEIPIIVTESTEQSMTIIESTEAAITVTESTEIPIIVTQSTEQSMTIIESTEAAITVAESTEIPIIVTESTEQSMTAIESTEAAITVTESTEQSVSMITLTEEPITMTTLTEEPITITGSTEESITATASTEEPVILTQTTEEPITVTEATEEPITVTESTEAPIIVTESTEQSMTITESTELPIIVTESTEQSMTITESTELPIIVTESTEEPITITEVTEEPITLTASTEESIIVTESTEAPIIVTESTEESITVTEATEEAITATSLTEQPITATETTEGSTTVTESTEEPITVTESTEPPITVTESTEEPITVTESTEAPVTVTESTEEPITMTASTEEPITVTESTEESITVTTSTEEPIIVTETTEEPITVTETTEGSITLAESTEQPTTATEATEEPITVTESTEESITVTEVTEEAITATSLTEEPITVIKSTEISTTVTESTEESMTIAETTQEPITVTETTEESITVTESTEAPIIVTVSTEEPITVTVVTEEPITVSASTEAPVTVAESTEEPITVTTSTEESIIITETTEGSITVTESTEEPITVTVVTEEPITVIQSTEAPLTVTELTEEPITVTTSTEESIIVTETTKEAITATEATEEPITVTESTEIPTTVTESTEQWMTMTALTEEPITMTGSTEMPVTVSASTEEPITVTESTEQLVTISASTEELITVTGSTEIPVTVSGSTEEPITVTRSTETSNTVSESSEQSITMTASTEEPMTGTGSSEILTSVTALTEGTITVTETAELETGSTTSTNISTPATTISVVTQTGTNGLVTTTVATATSTSLQPIMTSAATVAFTGTGTSTTTVLHTSNGASTTTVTSTNTVAAESTVNSTIAITSATISISSTPSTSAANLTTNVTSTNVATSASFSTSMPSITSANAGTPTNTNTAATTIVSAGTAISSISVTGTGVTTSATISISTFTSISTATSATNVTSSNITVSTATLTSTGNTTAVTGSSITGTSTSTSMSTITTATPQVCAWTSWVSSGNCTPSCGIAYRTLVRSCIDTSSGQTCPSVALCGGGSAVQNATCPSSPPCETQNATLLNSSRDPNIQVASYQLPDPMYFFEQTYRRIWISSKGYITFDTPFYSQTMTNSAFQQISNQAIAAPFWSDLLYDNTFSVVTINWFSSTNTNGSDARSYDSIIQSVIDSACPSDFCSLNFAATRVVQIDWQNLVYVLPNNNQSINISFSAYLINTYEYSYYSYPILRSYLAYDYSNLPTSLGYLRPFVGYRGKYYLIQISNDPLYYQNAAFLGQRQPRNFYVGGRFLSQCEVSFLQETQNNILYPSENLNDEINNPRVSCPCTLGQAQVDGRFGRLFSETSYEVSQNIVCYAPLSTTWIRWNGAFKLLRSQTCCYNQLNPTLITSGPLAGSVLSNPSILFQPYPWLRRITFHDQCCSPSYTTGYIDWNTCQLYYQLHPSSSCSGYQAPAIVTGVGDPHVTTIDNGRYTCHIQGLFVFAQTTTEAATTAQNNVNQNVIDSNRIYPDDLFQIYVRSVNTTPVLYYIQRTQGYGSIFSSYTIIAVNRTFVISNNNGNFGFTTSTGVSLTAALSGSLVYDYTNLNTANINSSTAYGYRVQQRNQVTLNKSTLQLTLTLWSGLSVRCQIIGENLDCVLILPQKFRAQIEGLIGNFNGNYSDDLSNRDTNQIVTISDASTQIALDNDADVLSACRSWKVPTDITSDISFPISPTRFVNWYYNTSNVLAGLNPLLSANIVSQTCGSSVECIHDYLIRINPFTSASTASGLQTFAQSRSSLAEVLPTVTVASNGQIVAPVDNPNRNYPLSVSINGSTSSSVLVTIYTNNSTQNSILNGNSLNITIPMPNSTTSFVEVSLTMNYGINSTLIQFLDITACLCANNGTCDYTVITTLSVHYKLASCNCLDQYQGDLCELPYNGCISGSACRVNWNNGTICTPLTAIQQVAQNRAYNCYGTCQNGYTSLDNFTCSDINECNLNSTLCGPGQCINLIGSYTCNCTKGYRFDNQTCVDLDECTEPNTDGSFPLRCNLGEVCTNTDGNYTCPCSPIFNTTGRCSYDPSLCNFTNNDTCVANNSAIYCLRNALNVSNICLPWCRSTCPGFCDLMNDTYQCNCMTKYPGYQYSDNGKACLQCRGPNYGYGCAEPCECVHGTCNPNATSVNQSCNCGTVYQAPLCIRLVDICATSTPCNTLIEDCATDPNNGSAICTCKIGYERSSTTGNCTDIDECALNTYNCDTASSTCGNTIGSYVCLCNSGYQSINGSCFDINECLNSTSCASYTNTYCTNTPGSYECRCSSGYSVGGDKTRTFEDIRNTTNTCIQTNYSSDCINTCQSLATCNGLTGQCECPITTMYLVAADIFQTKQTCICPGDPFVNYTNGVCDSSIGQTWFLIYFNLTSLGSSGRYFNIYSPSSSTLEAQIDAILNGMNKTSNGATLQVTQTNNTDLAPYEIFVALSIALNATERLQLINGFYNRNISLNSSYVLAIRMIINENTKKLETFPSAVAPCQECFYLGRGSCDPNNNNSCFCADNYQGYLCRNEPSTPLQSTSSTNWIVIVAVVSAIAGLLLIIALVTVIFYIIRRYRHRSIGDINSTTVRGTYTIPRVHLPIFGTVGQNNSSQDDTLASYPPSSATNYNPTYRTEEPAFGIFDDLDRHRPFGPHSLPHRQMTGMAGTLNSFPYDPSGRPNLFSESNEIQEIELVTDMLDDMTKDDDLEDEFVEALNPNIFISGTTGQPEYRSSGWYLFFRNS